MLTIGVAVGQVAADVLLLLRQFSLGRKKRNEWRLKVFLDSSVQEYMGLLSDQHIVCIFGHLWLLVKPCTHLSLNVPLIIEICIDLTLL